MGNDSMQKNVKNPKINAQSKLVIDGPCLEAGNFWTLSGKALSQVVVSVVSRRRSLILLGIKLSISTALIFYLLCYQISNHSEIWTAMASADINLLILSFSLHIVGYLLCSWRWQLLLKAQGVHVQLTTLANSYLVGIFFNSFLPGIMGGDVIRASDTSKPTKSLTKALLILFVERLTGMIALIILALLALSIIGRASIGSTNILYILLTASGFIFFPVILLFNHHFRSLVKHLLKLPLVCKLSKIAETTYQASEVFRGKKSVIIVCVLISIIFQLNIVIHYFLIGKALEILIPWYYYFTIIPVASLILMLPASINGIGLREQTFVYFFGNFGVSATAAVSLAWIAFGMVIVQAIIGGIVFAFRRR